MCCAQLYSMAETPQLPPSPRIWTRNTRALLVSKDRRHLFVTPWCSDTPLPMVTPYILPWNHAENRKKNPTLQLHFVGLGSNPPPPHHLACVRRLLIHGDRKNTKIGRKGGHSGCTASKIPLMYSFSRIGPQISLQQNRQTDP